MKLPAHIVAATVGLLTLAGGSTVKAASPELQALVPFAFSGANTTLEAGSYTAERASGPRGALIIRSKGGAVIFLALPGEAAAAGKSSRLVFHRYGDRYYLRQVWFHGTSGYGVPETEEANRRRAPASGRWGPALLSSSPHLARCITPERRSQASGTYGAVHAW